MSKRKADESILSSTKDIDITSLPDGVLSHISGYVLHSSRPLFAVAMTAPPSSFRIHNCNELPQSTMRDAILFPRNRDEYEKDWDDMHLLRESQVNWNEIDFGGIYKVIGADGLTDDTIHAALVCIGVSRIKVLELTRCTNICRGLEPMRKSKVLERIDLSGVKTWSIKQSKNGHTVGPSKFTLSASIVIPILESIVDETENSLRHIQLPKHWRGAGIPNTNTGGGNESLHRFLIKFNDNITGKIICGNCDSACQGGVQLSGARYDYGVQRTSCENYLCLANVCGSCSRQRTKEFCTKCEKYHCSGCSPGTGSTLMCCGKLQACGSCSDTTYCARCDTGPICDDCCTKCTCGQQYCGYNCKRKFVTFCPVYPSLTHRFVDFLR
jgi:hypothetical protein